MPKCPIANDQLPKQPLQFIFIELGVYIPKVKRRLHLVPKHWTMAWNCSYPVPGVQIEGKGSLNRGTARKHRERNGKRQGEGPVSSPQVLFGRYSTHLSPQFERLEQIKLW